MRGSVNHRSGWTLLELLVVVMVIGLLLLLLLPAVQAARAAAWRTQCQSHLHGWGQAVQAYLAARGRYPLAATWREGEAPAGRPFPARHSLFTYLLPFCDQGPLSQTIDLSRDWDDPVNVVGTKQWLGGIFVCPAAPGRRRDKHVSDYTTAVRVDPSDLHGLGPLLRTGRLRDRSGRGPPSWGDGLVVWQGLLALQRVDYRRAIDQRPVVRPRDVKDGLSKTTLLLENAGKPICYRFGRRADCQITRFRWASPNIWMTINDVCHREQLMNCHNNSQPYSFHRGGIYLLFADGAVHWKREDMAADVLVSHITRAARD